jgi:ATP-dependent DNA ligase
MLWLESIRMSAEADKSPAPVDNHEGVMAKHLAGRYLPSRVARLNSV